MRVGSLSAPGTPCGLGVTSMLGTGADLLWLGNGVCGRRERRARGGVELADPALHALARVAQLGFELGELAGAMAYELELAVEVAERFAEQLAAAHRIDVLALQLSAHVGARLLDAEQRLELLEGDAEQLFQTHHVAQPLDLGVGVEAMLSGRSCGCLRQQADLLVVADRARRRADGARDVADAQARLLGVRGRRRRRGVARSARSGAHALILTGSEAAGACSVSSRPGT